MNLGIIIHISGRDSAKCAQFSHLLGKTLRDQGHLTTELFEQQVSENLISTDNDLLARAIVWAGELLLKTETLVLVAVSIPLSQRVADLYRHPPAIELTIDQDFLTAAPERMQLTAEVNNLPQEIAQVVLLIEKITTSQPSQLPKPVSDDSIYSAEEEALLEEHLKALGYL